MTDGLPRVQLDRFQAVPQALEVEAEVSSFDGYTVGLTFRMGDARGWLDLPADAFDDLEELPRSGSRVLLAFGDPRA